MSRIFCFNLLVFSLLITDTLSAKKADKIRIGLCTDVHLATMHDSKYRLTTFIDSMKIAKPDFIIELGDFETPKKGFAAFFDIWDSFPGDKYHVIGNHEMDDGISRQTALENRRMPKSYYSFNKNGFHFIVLDGNDPINPGKKGYKQFIGPEQIAWLKNDLEKTEFPVVIFSHQGLSHFQGADEEYGVENYTQVELILETYNLKNPSRKVIACFNGHTHNDNAEQINGIWYITITSMSYHWLGEKYAHVRYSADVDKSYKWIKYTAPFKEPLFTEVEISKKGFISIGGKKTEWVGPTPFELGYPEKFKQTMRPAISARYLRFSLGK